MYRIRSPVSWRLMVLFVMMMFVVFSCSKTSIVIPTNQPEAPSFVIEIGSLYQEWGLTRIRPATTRLAIRDIYVYGGETVGSGRIYKIAVRQPSTVSVRLIEAEPLLAEDLQIHENAKAVEIVLALDEDTGFDTDNTGSYLFYELGIPVSPFNNFVVEVVIFPSTGVKVQKYFRGKW